MANSVLSEDRFQNEDAAFAYVESALWPEGPICPHCGNADAKRIRKMEGKTTRAAFTTATSAASRSPCASEPSSSVAPAAASVAANHPSDVRQQERHFDQSGSANALLQHENRLVLTTASARRCATAPLRPWAERAALSKSTKPLSAVRTALKSAGCGHKNAVLTLVERGGAARSFHIEKRPRSDVPIVRENIARESHVMTDEANRYATWQRVR